MIACVKLICALCDSTAVVQEVIIQEFAYGVGEQSVVLSVEVILNKCTKCGFEFLDSSSEDAREKAVTKHLEGNGLQG